MSTVTSRTTRSRAGSRAQNGPGVIGGGGPPNDPNPGGGGPPNDPNPPPGGPGAPGDGALGNVGGPIAFALSPSHINNKGLLDYKTKAGLASYEMAVAPLSKDLYDGAKENTHLFRAEFLRRAVASGWDSGAGDIVNIPNGNNHMEQKNFNHYTNQRWRHGHKQILSIRQRGKYKITSMLYSASSLPLTVQ